MTENENNLLEYYERTIQECVKECDGNCSLRDKECECVDANVLDHLKELQAYRAIGTAEGYESAIQSSIENYNLYREYKAKVQEFEAIGTVEEFKHYKHIVHMAELAIDSVEKEKAEIRNKAIDEFLHNAEAKIYDRILQNQARLEFASGLAVANRLLDEIAKQMKAGAE